VFKEIINLIMDDEIFQLDLFQSRFKHLALSIVALWGHQWAFIIFRTTHWWSAFMIKIGRTFWLLITEWLLVITTYFSHYLCEVNWNIVRFYLIDLMVVDAFAPFVFET
jgi:hypothetical protein